MPPRCRPRFSTWWSGPAWAGRRTSRGPMDATADGMSCWPHTRPPSRTSGSVPVHGGFLVKVAAEVAYQTDLHPDEVLFWVTDLGWIMGPWEIVGAGAL